MTHVLKINAQKSSSQKMASLNLRAPISSWAKSFSFAFAIRIDVVELAGALSAKYACDGWRDASRSGDPARMHVVLRLDVQMLKSDHCSDALTGDDMIRDKNSHAH